MKKTVGEVCEPVNQRPSSMLTEPANAQVYNSVTEKSTIGRHCCTGDEKLTVWSIFNLKKKTPRSDVNLVFDIFFKNISLKFCTMTFF